MKILLAPDSFKGSLTAKQACDAMEEGIRRAGVDAEIVKVPLADGGEGTVQSLTDATGGTIYEAEVQDPLGRMVTAEYGILGDGVTAVIEMAEASGLVLVEEKLRDPRVTSTYGTGELILAALDRGCRKFILGIGGSATNDGGAGMAQALGIRLLDEEGDELARGGGQLDKLHRVDVSGMRAELKDSTFLVACDVDNPLSGPNGASAVFGPQKGATPEMVEELDRNLAHYADVLKRNLGVDVKDIPGAGAAGGLGAGLQAFLNSCLKSGIDIVLETVEFERFLEGADLVLSGEGQIDYQTVRGKTPFGVAQVGSAAGVPVVLLAGSIGSGAEVLYEHGVQSYFSIVSRPMTVEEAMCDAFELLADATEQVIRVMVK
ncbi:glycerate kinase [Fictibacillus aquaticus]|uniref:Glycerate kinase n=1 Tax=Fictibacillus aquaticus TaxID=2021314 RepID=A0A235FA06_9BACL|nr:glycerate kinase [Fictibacillus aquaticus]OYD57565.1 glycerate kinase [Fictibacillus aquaticus]